MPHSPMRPVVERAIAAVDEAEFAELHEEIRMCAEDGCERQAEPGKTGLCIACRKRNWLKRKPEMREKDRQRAAAWKRQHQGAGVPLEPFVGAFERSGMTAIALAERAGYMRLNGGRQTGDGTKVLRLLALAPYSKRGRRSVKKSDTIPFNVAVRFAKALEMDPHEAGI